MLLAQLLEKVTQLSITRKLLPKEGPKKALTKLQGDI